MSENGRVCIGFSRPWVARYSANAGVVTYSNAIRAGRGVSIDVQPTSSDDNKFDADNQTAESADGVFTGGTATLTIDGFYPAAGKVMFGRPDPDGNGWIHDGDDAVAPYCALGFIAKFMSGGVVSYVPYILRKGKFSAPGNKANTQGSEIEWQTQELTMSLMRDDTSKHDWRFEGVECASEDDAETMIKTALNVATDAFGLTALTIGTLDLAPEFDINTLEYTTTTSNATNTITATATAGANVIVLLNGDSMANGGTATWEEGANSVEIIVKKGDITKTYTVAVTKE